MSTSSVEQQAPPVTERLSCIKERVIASQANVFFMKPAAQFKRGTQIGGQLVDTDSIPTGCEHLIPEKTVF